MTEWITCESCEVAAPKYDKHGQQIMEKYNDTMLCSSCRVDQRLADGDFSA